MKMLYRLARIVAHIADESVSVLEPELLCDLWYSLKDLCHVCGVIRTDSIRRRDVGLGHDEAMHGSLRIYIEKSVAVVILINLFGRNVSVYYSTE